jgi:putative SOS response-associated peptidase YedK
MWLSRFHEMLQAKDPGAYASTTAAADAAETLLLIIRRRLTPADGFYEFTAAKDAKAKRKDKWLFTPEHSDLFAIAGMRRTKAANGEDA